MERVGTRVPLDYIDEISVSTAGGICISQYYLVHSSIYIDSLFFQYIQNFERFFCAILGLAGVIEAHRLGSHF